MTDPTQYMGRDQRSVDPIHQIIHPCKTDLVCHLEDNFFFSTSNLTKDSHQRLKSFPPTKNRSYVPYDNYLSCVRNLSVSFHS